MPKKAKQCQDVTTIGGAILYETPCTYNENRLEASDLFHNHRKTFIWFFDNVNLKTD